MARALPRAITPASIFGEHYPYIDAKVSGSTEEQRSLGLTRLVKWSMRAAASRPSACSCVERFIFVVNALGGIQTECR